METDCEEYFDETLIGADVALAALVRAEIAYAKREVQPGSTLTRTLDRYEDGEAIVSVFITTSLKGDLPW